MDVLKIGDLTFPVRSGTLSKGNGEGEYRWGIEVNCDYANQPDSDSWMTCAAPYLYAQMLPLCVQSPDELVGRTYSFPESPFDDPASWDCGQWPFFCLYLLEHDYLFPVTVRFKAKLDGRYHLHILGKYPCDEEVHELELETWLTWDS